MAAGLAANSVGPSMASSDDAQRQARLDLLPAVVDRPLRIAMLAPPWIAVPPPGYGGVEHVVALLADELTRRGHLVTLLAAPGSRSVAHVRALLPDTHPDRIGASVFEADHVARAFAAIDHAREDGLAFDVIHDHSGFTALAMADRIYAPMVHTIHGPFIAETSEFYSANAHRATTVAISEGQRKQAPPAVRESAVIPNPIGVGDWPLRRSKDRYLLWIGRMAKEKGPHRAIEIARRSGRQLLMAGPVQPGQESFFESEIAPHLDDRGVRYLGEVGGQARTELFARASALLMPIRWQEPFGMVMVEALACGTPVIAYSEGAANEVVLHGENGFLVSDEAEATRAVGELHRIDPARCRSSVASRYAPASIAASYERVYRMAAGIGRPREAEPRRRFATANGSPRQQAPHNGADPPSSRRAAARR
jgi:glycosyltransferase involved in cell wall biosynthesis